MSATAPTVGSITYHPQQSVSGSYRVRVRVPQQSTDGGANTMRLTDADILQYRMILEMLALATMTEDIVGDLMKLPQIKGKYTSYCRTILSKLNGYRRYLKRTISREKCDKFQVAICDIVDDSETHVKWCMTMVRDILVNKIPYQDVEAAALLGVAGGYIDIMQQIHQALYGKKSHEYADVYFYLKHIDTALDFQMLNDDKQPDYESAKAAMVKMFTEIGLNCNNKLMDILKELAV